MANDPKTLEALKAAHVVLSALVRPNMNESAIHIFARAVEAETKVRAEIERRSR